MYGSSYFLITIYFLFNFRPKIVFFSTLTLCQFHVCKSLQNLSSHPSCGHVQLQKYQRISCQALPGSSSIEICVFQFLAYMFQGQNGPFHLNITLKAAKSCKKTLYFLILQQLNCQIMILVGWSLLVVVLYNDLKITYFLLFV